jgi:hypothetical protein
MNYQNSELQLEDKMKSNLVGLTASKLEDRLQSLLSLESSHLFMGNKYQTIRIAEQIVCLSILNN